MTTTAPCGPHKSENFVTQAFTLIRGPTSSQHEAPPLNLGQAAKRPHQSPVHQKSRGHSVVP
jgi:hypothetical protein